MKRGFLILDYDTQQGALRDPRSCQVEDYLASRGLTSKGVKKSTWGDAPPPPPHRQNSMRENPFKGVLRSPVTDGVPKVTLTNYYSERFQTTLLRKSCFETRGNNAPKTKDIRYTSVFICPLTCTKFPSGQWGSEYQVSEDNVVWFYNKSGAEHAAAARALDSLSFNDPNDYYFGLCKDDPLPLLAKLESKQDSSLKNTHVSIDSPVKLVSDWLASNYQVQLERKRCFRYYNNGAAPHLLKWRSELICPVSGNIYSSDSALESPHLLEDEHVWFPNKALAERAAASVMLEAIGLIETSKRSLLHKYPPKRPKEPVGYVEPHIETQRFLDEYRKSRGPGPGVTQMIVN